MNATCRISPFRRCRPPWRTLDEKSVITIEPGEQDVLRLSYAPTAPSNLTVEDRNDHCGSQILRWTASTDDTDPPSAIRYLMFFDGVLNGSVTGTGRAWNTCIELGPTDVFLRAVDTSGNVSAPSNTITIDCTDV